MAATGSKAAAGGEPVIGLELLDFPPSQREMLSAQHQAFVAPRAAELLDGLRAAGMHLPRPVTVCFTHSGPNSVRPGDPAWAHTATPAPDTGLELVERVLVQLGASTLDSPLSPSALHSLAAGVIQSVVDPTYVSALHLDRPAPYPTPKTSAQPGRGNGELLICSIAANAHDSSVAIATEDEVLIVLEAERIHRQKRKWCNAAELEQLAYGALAAVGHEPADVTHWTGTAMLNGLLPSDRRTCAWTAAIPARILSQRVTFLAVNHHLAHAALAFANPPGPMVVEACDGGGDGRRYAAFAVDRSSIEPVESPGERVVSGSFYDICSYYLYKEYAQQGKLMGLAAHGEPDPELGQFLHEHASTLSFGSHEDGYELLHGKLGIERHDPGDPRVRDAACTAQRAFVEMRVAQAAALASGASRLVLTGGAALNIHANSAIAAALPECEVIVPPCCDDTGQALGALLHTAVCHLGIRPRVGLPFLGTGVNQPSEIDEASARRVADDLLAGRVVAWHYGRAEIGPRALGHRSLLCIPHTIEDRVRISERVKGRESYRPVAPVVLADRVADWFEPARLSAHMLFSATATERCHDEAPAGVHIDGSARIQTVARDEQPLGPILSEMEKRTGIPLLLNTSLNGPGEPIANEAKDTLAFAKCHPDVVPWIDNVRIDQS